MVMKVKTLAALALALALVLGCAAQASYSPVSTLLEREVATRSGPSTNYN